MASSVFSTLRIIWNLGSPTLVASYAGLSKLEGGLPLVACACASFSHTSYSSHPSLRMTTDKIYPDEVSWRDLDDVRKDRARAPVLDSK